MGCVTTYSPCKATDLPPALIARFGFVLGDGVDRPKALPDCWDWPHLDERGYGRVSTYLDGRIVKERAHRVSWLVLVGEDIPPGVVVRHLCGRNSCMRPEHLALGTQVDNLADAKRHGTVQSKKLCSVDGCDRTAKSQGYCGAHRERVRKYGDPIAWLPVRLTRGGRSLVTS